MINTHIFHSLSPQLQLCNIITPKLSEELSKKISAIWNKFIENIQPPLQNSLENIKGIRLNFSWNYALPLILFAFCVGGAYYLYHWWSSLKKSGETNPSNEISTIQQEVGHSNSFQPADKSEIEDGVEENLTPGKASPRTAATFFDEVTPPESIQNSDIHEFSALLVHRLLNECIENSAMAQEDHLSLLIKQDNDRILDEVRDSFVDLNHSPHSPVTPGEEIQIESVVENEGEIPAPPSSLSSLDAAEFDDSFILLVDEPESPAQNTRLPLWKQEQEEKTVQYIRKEMCQRFDKNPKALLNHWLLLSSSNRELVELNTNIIRLLTPEDIMPQLNGFQIKVGLLHALGDFYKKRGHWNDIPEIKEFIHSLVQSSVSIPLWKYFEHVVFQIIDIERDATSSEPVTIVDLLKRDFHQIGVGRFHWLEREFNKACGAIGINFAPNLGTNYFSILWKEHYTTNDGESIEVPVYRFGTPTQDDRYGYSTVLPVFELWIDALQASNKRHCYFGHQDRHGAEGRRTDALIALSDEKPAFFMFNLPLDGELYKSKIQKMAASFKNELLAAMLESKHGFYFPIEKIKKFLPAKDLEEIFSSCIDEVWTNFFSFGSTRFFREDTLLSPQNQRTFILLTYVKIEQYFSSNLKASRNSTCKDGIDRAAIVNTLCYYLGALATSKSWTEEDERRITNETRVVLHHAALFTKGQAVIKSRRDDLLKVLEFLSYRQEESRRGFNLGDITLSSTGPIKSEVCSASHDNVDNFILNLRIESPTLEFASELPPVSSDKINEITDRQFSYFSSLFFRDGNGKEFQESYENVLPAIKENPKAHEFLARVQVEDMIEKILRNIRKKFCIDCDEESIDTSSLNFSLETILSPTGEVEITCRANTTLLRRSSSLEYEDKVIGNVEAELVANSTKSEMNYKHTLSLESWLLSPMGYLVEVPTNRGI